MVLLRKCADNGDELENFRPRALLNTDLKTEQCVYKELVATKCYDVLGYTLGIDENEVACRELSWIIFRCPLPGVVPGWGRY